MNPSPTVEPIPAMKTCTKCRQTLPIKQFSRNKSMKYGVQARCKACCAADSASWREAHPGRNRAIVAAWREAYPEKAHATALAYRAAHREQARKKTAAWRAADPERARACDAANYMAHRARAIAAAIAYASAHPEQRRMSDATRRARQHQSPVNDFTAAQWRDMKAHYKYRCVYCGQKPKCLTMDHITPLARGGAHTASNIVPACGSCNSRKWTGEVLVPIQPLLMALI